MLPPPSTRFGFAAMAREKFTSRFAFPLVLDAGRFMCDEAGHEGEAIYELFSVVSHSGSSPDPTCLDH